MAAVLGEPWTRQRSRPLVLGHRGARHAAPENTFAAFDLALDEGADGIELDVRANASGEVVVCHDLTLERVTSGRDVRAVHTLSARECDALRLDGGQALPRLSDVLAWAERRDACVNVEIKSDGPAVFQLVAAVAALTRCHTPVRLLVSCFNPFVVLAHQWLAPSVPTAWLFESRRGVRLSPLLSLGSAALHPRESLLSPRLLGAWCHAGKRIHTWTVNDPERARELAASGVHGLISDNPGRLLHVLRDGGVTPSK